MTRVESLTWRNVAFLAIAVVLAVVLVLRPSETVAVRTADLPLLLPDLDPAKAVTIEIERRGGEAGAAEGSIRLERLATRDDSVYWVVASAADHPALTTKVQGLLEALAAGRRQDVVADDPATFDRFHDWRGWRRVRVRDEKDRVLADLEVGKTSYPATFVKVEEGGAPRVLQVWNLALDGRLEVDVGSWVERRLFPDAQAEDVERIEVVQHEEEGRRLVFVRPAAPAPAADGSDGAPEEPPAPPERRWKMTRPEAAEADDTKVANLVRTVTGMRLTDVVRMEGETEPDLAAYGLEPPAYEVVVTPQGVRDARQRLRLRVGHVDDASGAKRWYAVRGDDPWVFQVGETDVRELGEAPEAYLPKPPGEEDDEEGAEEGEGEGHGRPGTPDGETPAPDGEPGSPDGETPPPDEGEGEGEGEGAGADEEGGGSEEPSTPPDEPDGEERSED